MNTHNFISPPMMGMYKESCLVDFWSPRCNLFKMEFNAARARLNRYSNLSLMKMCTRCARREAAKRQCYSTSLSKKSLAACFSILLPRFPNAQARRE